MSEAPEDWIGRARTQTASVEPELVRRYAAAIGAPLEVEAHFPPLGHWALFNDTVDAQSLGFDGHPRRGLFLPPIELPRRMFAASELTFEAPPAFGREATLVSTVTDLRRRSGRSGELVLVDVERRLSQGDGLRLVERQTIVYRQAGEPTAAVVEAETGDGEIWRPSAVDLFRFSAATFNAHRIHYDQAYARDEEGYPELVVQGPFTAAKLCALAQQIAGGPLKSFSFRAQAPLFVGQAVRLAAKDEPGSLVAVRCDGQVAMSATFEGRP
jgi:3-methylfumaryl-CoA hydratase